MGREAVSAASQKMALGTGSGCRAFRAGDGGRRWSGSGSELCICSTGRRRAGALRLAGRGELNPLGPSASQFPGVFERDQRGILRVKGDVDALASWAEQADMPYITDGDGIAIPAKYAKQAEKAIKGYRPVAAEPVAEDLQPLEVPAFQQLDLIELTPAYQRQGDTVDRATEPQAVTGTLDSGSEIGGMFAGEHNPLGSDKFDPVREVPAFQRQGFVRGAHDFKGTPIVPLEGNF